MQNGERESDGVLALAADLVGTVHALADIAGHLLIQRILKLGQLIGDRFGPASGEELLAIEGQQVFFDHPAHDPGGVGGLGVLALEAVAVEQGEEQLEVLFLARVGRGRHQQQVAGDLAEHLAQLEALGLLQLATEVVGAHAVGLVDDDQVPLGFLELGLEFLVAGELVHAGDQQGIGVEDVEVDVGVDELVGQ